MEACVNAQLVANYGEVLMVVFFFFIFCLMEVGNSLFLLDGETYGLLA